MAGFAGLFYPILWIFALGAFFLALFFFGYGYRVYVEPKRLSIGEQAVWLFMGLIISLFILYFRFSVVPFLVALVQSAGLVLLYTREVRVYFKGGSQAANQKPC